MKASPEAQLRLIELARLDGERGHAGFEQANLPVHAELKQAEEEAVRLASRLTRIEAAQAAARDESTRAELEIDNLTEQVISLETKLNSGEGLTSRDLLVLQGEIAGHREHIAALEEEELVAMGQTEDLEGHHRTQSEAIAANNERLTELRATRDSQVAALTAQATQLTAQRDALAAELPADLVDAYDHSRTLSGVGVVVMQPDGTVDGGLDLSLVEIEEIRRLSPDDVYLTEDAGAVVVRLQE